MAPLDANVMFACLERHGVRFVLIGGLAAVLHGSPLPTLDANICPSRDADNLTRLASALDELDARIRSADAPEGVPFPRDAAFLGCGGRTRGHHSLQADREPAQGSAQSAASPTAARRVASARRSLIVRSR